MGRRGLEAEATVERSVLTTGDTLIEICRLDKRSIWPAAWLEVEWLDGERDSLALLGGRTRTVRHEVTLSRRGRYLAGGGRVVARDPLGLMTWTAAVLPSVPVTVYPRPMPAPEAVETVRTLAARDPRRRFGAADATIGNLRDYVEGDAPTRIHWRTTARRGVLTVTEPESPRRLPVWLLVDLGGGDDAAEISAGIAVYLADALHRRGRSIGVIVAGEDMVVAQIQPDRDGLGHILLPLAETPAAPDSQIERLVDWAGQASDPRCLVLVSATAIRRESLVRRLKAAHSRAEIAVVVAGEAAA
jgi:uncharacterized protein (DUF58 family)